MHVHVCKTVWNLLVVCTVHTAAAAAADDDDDDEKCLASGCSLP